MDYVASRETERDSGWRQRISDFLGDRGAIVFDPWFKPDVRGFDEYGREDVSTDRTQLWTFDPSKAGAERRSRCAAEFWPTVHIDLRMVDTSDFLISYCPTNVYSVGTPHEIIISRQQKKPVLFVSPPVELDALAALETRLAELGDEQALAHLSKLKQDIPKPNPDGRPSLWYTGIVDSESFFDGFDFASVEERYGWPESALAQRERTHRPQKGLIPFLERVDSGEIPLEWNRHTNGFQPNEDWMLWEFGQSKAGAEVQGVHGSLGADIERLATD